MNKKKTIIKKNYCKIIIEKNKVIKFMIKKIINLKILKNLLMNYPFIY